MTIRNLLIDPTTGDLAVKNGALQLVSDAAAIQQAINSALRTVAGEWFLDATVGVPYFQVVLVKNPNPDVLKKVFTDAIASVQGVKQVLQLDLNFTPATRSLSIAYRAQLDAGQLVNASVLVT